MCVAGTFNHRSAKIRRLANDAILAVLSNAGLAVGILVALSAGGQRRFDFESYLFGNFLSVTGVDVILIAAFSAVAIIGIAVFWRRLLIITLTPTWRDWKTCRYSK
ncbi:MAG: metal ABC transporter permease [Candidatus Zeuxoniibacter abyssi]|nr:MAG: metal ABC transporter permease [Candidatus Persebacteraceae bacterium AB1(2)]